MDVKAEIITIGDEILYGQTNDTNATWISEQLDRIGVKTQRRTTIGDEKEDIINALDAGRLVADIILITGGLGPTRDDLTKPCLSEYFDSPLTLNENALDDIRKLFRKIGRELTELNRQQAMLPDKCIKITNRMGTAPGMWFDVDNQAVISMPGVPYEMKEMMEAEVIPMIRKRFKTQVVYHKIIKTVGIGESWLADEIKPWEDALPKNIKLAYLPSLGQVKLRLTAKGEDREELERDVEKQIDKLQDYAGKFIYGYDNDTLEAVLGKLLKEQARKVSIAESCTGGFLAHSITAVSGSSQYFMGAVIAYDNSVKVNVLNIAPETLEKHGAVSEEVIIQMAENVRKVIKSDIGVATSGIAGPTGGTTEKPVGTIWIAVSDDNGTESKKLTYGKNRMINIEFTAITAMDMIRQRLLKSS